MLTIQFSHIMRQKIYLITIADDVLMFSLPGGYEQKQSIMPSDRPLKHIDFTYSSIPYCHVISQGLVSSSVD